jgi:broad specificity phosphatase PhoE
MATQLICLRHAEAEPPIWDSSRGAVGGGAPPDPPLTARGRRPAEAVAHRLLGKRPQKVFVSEALRSRQTGEIIASMLGAPIEVVPTLAEVSMGSGERAPSTPGLAAEVLRQWIVYGKLSVRLMDGETGHEVALRMKRALIEIGATCHDRLAIVVGHVASLTVGVDALCQNGPALWGKPLPHATPFVLSVSSEGWHAQWPDSSQESVIL